MTELPEYKVDEGNAGSRLDAFLTSQIDGLGRRRAGLLCQAGEVRVNGRRSSKSTPVRVGDLVALSSTLPEVLGHAAPSAEIAFEVLVERPDLLIVAKPSGLPSVSLPGSRRSLASGLLHRFPELQGVGHHAREPGLLHRLDTQTSGLLLIARHTESFQHLSAELTAGRIEKRYLAVVRAGVPEGQIVAPLQPDTSDRRRVRVGGDSLRTSEVRLIREAQGRSLIEVSVTRAYRHQIRMHLAHIGYPLVGDLLYGGDRAGEAPAESTSSRHALHASYIAGTAADGDKFERSLELPADLEALLDA